MNAPATILSLFVALQILGSQTAASAVDDGTTKGQSPASRARPILEEVVVTAQRREEPLLDVPISASVLSSVEIERLQLDRVSTLQYATPNLTVTPYPGTQTRVTVGMRGQVEPELFPTLDPAAATVGVCRASPVVSHHRIAAWRVDVRDIRSFLLSGLLRLP